MVRMNRSTVPHTALRSTAFTWLVVGVCLAPAASFAAEPVDFNRDIRPIVFGTCVACHGPDEETREAGLRLDTFAGASEDMGGYAAIVPGDADASELIVRVETDDEGMRMPPVGHSKALTPEQIALLRRWIDEGAKYDQHWSYTKPTRPALPTVEHTEWPQEPLDYFILRQLESHGLQPSPAASRRVIARRVALGLTGLPPSPALVQSFLKDEQPGAYERYVDALLASPAFGERWARVWLDLARYADSAGYADDPSRTIWAFRDYVIRSFNQNKPFDQFTKEQIAGDLLEQPTQEQLIATAFHRNTMTNNEGGTNNEQFRNEAVVDRVNTTMAVWMGTTMACAQCHTHKYDPITQREYFAMFDFFNQSADADRRDESPVLQVYTDEQRQRRGELETRIAELVRKYDQQTPELDTALDAWLETFQRGPTWTPLKPSAVALQNVDAAASDEADKQTVQLNVDDEGHIRFAGERPTKAIYEVTVPTTEETAWTALQLRVAESQANNFVLSRATLRWEPETPAPIPGRFVRIELPGTRRILHLAEVEVLSGGTNIARNAQASQSSTDYGAAAQRAIDGNANGDFQQNSVTHSATEDNPWWEVDLGQSQPIDAIAIWNRTDGPEAIRNRLQGYRLTVLDEDRNVVWSADARPLQQAKLEYALSGTQRVDVVAAQSDFSQQNFPASAVLRGVSAGDATADDTGWAIGGGIGQPHMLTLFFERPLPARPGRLVVRLEQVSKFTQHLLTDFQLQATDSSDALRWADIPTDIASLLGKPQHTPQERDRVATYFRSVTPLLGEVRDSLQSARDELAAIRPTTTVPIMRDLPADKHRVTHVQIRGNYQSLDEQVSAGVPEVFHDLPEDAPRNRLALAEWLVSPENPLTPRVIVNRHWEQLFGVGLVETSEEFGSQGALPSHPALLDWLAVDLVENGWDIKRLVKQMVMSSTYRQSSRVTPELLEADPDNRWYARGPRFRISAEMVRDQALQLAGLLSPKMYGPPVRPPQPSSGLSAAFGSKTDWQTSTGADRYRRGIYTTWRRSNPYPSMATFDAPNREVCTIRRLRTNTPLQALVTLNDPVYVEAAQALARRGNEQTEPADAIGLMFETSLCRPASDAELARLEDLYDQLVQRYQADPKAARTMAEEPLGPLGEDQDPVRAAALTVVANVILNLDEMLMPR